jgi:energy-coupling factor transport system permease protein
MNNMKARKITALLLTIPMLMASSKAADELSVAAITRGIENPKQRTSRISLKIGAVDIIFTALYIAVLVVGIYLSRG